MRSTWTSAARAGFRGAAARPLQAMAAGERVAGDGLVSPDEPVPVDAAPAEAEARRRGSGYGYTGSRTLGMDSLEPQPPRRRRRALGRTGIVERGLVG